MKKQVLFVFAIGLICAGITYYAFQYGKNQAALSSVLVVNNEVATIKNELLGYTKYTSYLSEGKKVISEEMKFLAAKVVRQNKRVEHVQTSKLGIKSEATVIVTYSVEYNFGFNLKPDSFEIIGTDQGVEIKVHKPTLVVSPAVMPLSYEIPSKGFLIDEEATVIAIHQKLPALEAKSGELMASEESIQALCEKKLVKFLRDFLAKQPGVKQVPSITVSYI